MILTSLPYSVFAKSNRDGSSDAYIYGADALACLLEDANGKKDMLTYEDIEQFFAFGHLLDDRQRKLASSLAEGIITKRTSSSSSQAAVVDKRGKKRKPARDVESLVDSLFD